MWGVGEGGRCPIPHGRNTQESEGEADGGAGAGLYPITHGRKGGEWAVGGAECVLKARGTSAGLELGARPHERCVKRSKAG